MSKQAAIQTKQSSAPGFTRSRSSLFERRNTLGPHLCIQREAVGPAVHPAAPSLVREVVNSPGQPLDAATRAFMEPRFGHDFSRVRVHTDDRAAESARAVSANAYTAGNHVAFGAGQYTPGTLSGQRLMAHELVHVVQQASGPVAGSPSGDGLNMSHRTDSFERQARSVAAGDLYSGHGSVSGATRTVPSEAASADSGDLHVQRDGDASGAIGAIAGVAGVGVGVAALIYAIRQTRAAEHPPASVTPSGGLALNNTQFNTLDQPAPGSNQEDAGAAKPATKDILYLDAPATRKEQNHVKVGLTTTTDGHNIIDGFTFEQEVNGYRGGSDGPSATVTFTSAQTRPSKALASLPHKETPTAPAKTLGVEPESEKPASVSSPTAPKSSSADDVAEAMLRVNIVNGTNADGGQLQRFRGAWRIDGKGDVTPDKSQCAVTQGNPADFHITGSLINVGINSPSSARPSAPEPAPELPRPGPAEQPPKGDFGPEPPNVIKGIPA